VGEGGKGREEEEEKGETGGVGEREKGKRVTGGQNRKSKIENRKSRYGSHT
jgi:hypothetical protein